jgi:acyl-CoA reductase-like NAD-dependent aldehyde dehydrogenase
MRARNPLTGEFDFEFAAPGDDEIEAATKRLRAAQPRWRGLGPEARGAALIHFAEEIERRRTALFAALSADTGRRAIAEHEIQGSLALIRRWAEEAPRLLRESERPSAAHPNIAMRETGEPFALVGAISPWNFPLLLSMIDAIPALAAGCAVFIKPSEVTPRFVGPLMDAVAAATDVRDVLHVAAGDGAVGAALVPLVDCVAFTGSVATGRKVAEAAARAFIPAFLELGGKDPAIVLHGADLERAATAILRASVVSTGQACQSLERVYVDARSFDEFTRLLVEKAKATPLAFVPGGIIGPIIFSRQADVIAEHLRDAVDKGAVILCGGKIETHGGGRWIAPTVLTRVRHDMKVMTEETFGPVIPVMPFATIEEAVARANDSVYGLSAAVFGPTEADAAAVAERLEAGAVSINDAGLTTVVFEAEKTGFKLSGLGPSRTGASGLTRFLRRKALLYNRGPVAPIEAFAERD